MKKLLYLILFFSGLLVSCDTYPQVPGCTRPQVPNVVETGGEGDANNIVFLPPFDAYEYSAGMNLYVNYPDIYPDDYYQYGDIVTVSMLINVSHTFVAPDGWNIAYQEQHPNESVAVFWRRLDGTELYGFNETFTTAASLTFAVCVGFRGCKTTGEPFDVVVIDSIEYAQALIPAYTSAGSRYSFASVLIEDNSAVTSPANYTELATASTSNGTDASAYLYGRVVNNGSVAAEDVVIEFNEYNATIVLLLVAEP